jgi:hypothetical protein
MLPDSYGGQDSDLTSTTRACDEFVPGLNKYLIHMQFVAFEISHLSVINLGGQTRLFILIYSKVKAGVVPTHAPLIVESRRAINPQKESLASTCSS